MSFNICIIKLGAMGDVVRSTSLIPALLRKHPDAYITWITSPQAIPLLENDPRISVFPVDDWNVLQEEFDWVISLDDDIQACVYATMLRTGKLSGVHYSKLFRRPMYTDDMKEWFDMGILSEYGLEKANQLKKANLRTMYEIWYDGLELGRPIEKPKIYSPNTLPYGGGVMENKLIVGLNTQGGARWKYKSWTFESTLALATRLIDAGHYVVLLGGREEEAFNAELVKRLAEAILTCGDYTAFFDRPDTHNDVLYLNAVVDACDVLVTSDSLSMHLAISNNVPVVAFFGPTSGAEIDLFGNGIKLETSLPCGRCYLKDCDVRPTCMDVLSVDTVYDAVRKLLPVSWP